MKMRLLIIFLLIFNIVKAQTNGNFQVISTKGDTINMSTKNLQIFVKMDPGPQFEGGDKAWELFLAQNLDHPLLPFGKKEKIKGTIILQFVVLPDGTVGNLQAFHGDEILTEAALLTMKKTPKWIPANLNGTKVICYQKVAINFD